MKVNSLDTIEKRGSQVLKGNNNKVIKRKHTHELNEQLSDDEELIMDELNEQLSDDEELTMDELNEEITKKVFTQCKPIQKRINKRDVNALFNATQKKLVNKKKS